MDEPPAPTVPAELLDTWEQTEQQIQRLFDIGLAYVAGHTLVYEDAELRSQIQEARPDVGLSRVFFATRLGFSPSLPPGGAQLIKPRIIQEVQTGVADRFRERGFTDIQTTDQQQLSVTTGERATGIPYTAVYECAGTSIPVEGYAAVWHHDSFRIAGGAYPASIGELGIEVDTNGFRDELLAMIKHVR